MGRKRTEPEKLNGCFAKVRNLEQAADCWDERRSGGDIWRQGARASFQFQELLALSLCLPSVLGTSFLGLIPLGQEGGFCPLLFRDSSSSSFLRAGVCCYPVYELLALFGAVLSCSPRHAIFFFRWSWPSGLILFNHTTFLCRPFQFPCPWLTQPLARTGEPHQ